MEFYMSVETLALIFTLSLLMFLGNYCLHLNRENRSLRDDLHKKNNEIQELKFLREIKKNGKK